MVPAQHLDDLIDHRLGFGPADAGQVFPRHLPQRPAQPPVLLANVGVHASDYALLAIAEKLNLLIPVEENREFLEWLAGLEWNRPLGWVADPRQGNTTVFHSQAND